MGLARLLRRAASSLSSRLLGFARDSDLKLLAVAADLLSRRRLKRAAHPSRAERRAERKAQPGRSRLSLRRPKLSGLEAGLEAPAAAAVERPSLDL